MIAGIDIGTSSVKVILVDSKLNTVKITRAAYKEISPSGWFQAIRDALMEFDAHKISAVGLSSQVGTYIINEKDVITWKDPYGKDELTALKSEISSKEFLKEISMPHPDIISYPLPRLKYIITHFENVRSVCQVKDYIIKKLTGSLYTDKYSQRGIANLSTGEYSERLLSHIGASEGLLPPIMDPFCKAGCITKEAADFTGLLSGTPVYTGCNDFFSALLGMGIKDNDLFDITGTSEHVGVLTDKMDLDTKMVCGPYFKKNAYYGVTASSGVSLNYAGNFYNIDDINKPCYKSNTPIFLPYLNGERAPIFDPDARGVFFGVNSGTTQKDLAYAIAEGISFSVYHIFKKLDTDNISRIVVSGGSSRKILLNQIKANLFGKPVVTLKEKEASALGAAIIASCGEGILKSPDEALSYIDINNTFIPQKSDILIQRFEIYKELYPALKDQFTKYGRLL
ncbi:MAG: FGGY-family carbohydrate kinase [Bacillota bacterium]|nr:FGGY-family carbohydrate kinase [Bacillota bacterium]